MAEEKLDTQIPTDENGTVELSNGNEDPDELSPTLQNDEDEEKGDFPIIIKSLAFPFPFFLYDIYMYM